VISSIVQPQLNTKAMNKQIEHTIRESIRVKENLLSDSDTLAKINESARACVDCFKHDGKVLLCGNGGSAADAQHIAAELSGRFKIDRDPLFAEALHVNSSFVTAVANDYDYDEVYKRMVHAAGKKGDILFAISTSGNSGNVINAVRQAKKQGMITIGLTGHSGGKLKDLCTITIRVPSDDTARIQESHIMIGHIICDIVEKSLFDAKGNF
jgi:D-sedoheptulose 7-phosphate isomerase